MLPKSLKLSVWFPAVLFFMGCKAGLHQPCTVDDNCGSELTCSPKRHACASAAEIKAEQESNRKVSEAWATCLELYMPVVELGKAADKSGSWADLRAVSTALSQVHEQAIAALDDPKLKLSAEERNEALALERDHFGKLSKVLEEPLKEAEDKAKRVVREVEKVVTGAAAGKETSIGLASYFGAYMAMGWSVSDDGPSVAGYSAGTAKFKSRPLRAAVVAFNVPVINKAAGERRTDCLVQALIDDTEFEMSRAMLTKGCNDHDAADAVRKWKADNEFVEEFASGQVLPQ